MKKALFILFPVFVILSFGSCKKSNPADAIVGNYEGTVHYTFSSYYNGSSSYIDTTYNITFEVSSSSDGVFTTNEIPSFDAENGSYQYSSSNVYDLHWYSNYSSSGELQFSPSTNTVSYSVQAYDQEGGGTVYNATWSRTFSGKK